MRVLEFEVMVKCRINVVAKLTVEYLLVDYHKVLADIKQIVN